jgi:hypothetical protein
MNEITGIIIGLGLGSIAGAFIMCLYRMKYG